MTAWHSDSAKTARSLERLTRLDMAVGPVPPNLPRHEIEEMGEMDEVGVAAEIASASHYRQTPQADK